MYKYKIIIHDDKFIWTVTVISDQIGPIHSIEEAMMREGVQIHEYVDGDLYLSILGKRYIYYDEEK